MNKYNKNKRHIEITFSKKEAEDIFCFLQMANGNYYPEGVKSMEKLRDILEDFIEDNE